MHEFQLKALKASIMHSKQLKKKKINFPHSRQLIYTSIMIVFYIFFRESHSYFYPFSPFVITIILRVTTLRHTINVRNCYWV